MRFDMLSFCENITDLKHGKCIETMVDFTG